MADAVESLEIRINGEAQQANDAIDRLCLKLDSLITRLGGLDGSKLVGLANGVQRLGTAMNTMNGIKTTDFSRLARNIEKIKPYPGKPCRKIGKQCTTNTANLFYAQNTAA